MNIITLEGLTFPWYVKQWQITDSAEGGGGVLVPCTLYLVLFCSVNRKRTACATGKMGLKHSSSYRFTKPHCVGCRYFWGEKEIMASVMECRWKRAWRSRWMQQRRRVICVCAWGVILCCSCFQIEREKKVWNCCPTGNESCTCVVFFQYVVCVDECKTLHAKWRASENMMPRRTGEPKKVKANPGGRAA